MKKYICETCGYVYDPAEGDPDNGIAPGTAFEDLPDDWVCPLCGVGNDDFTPADCRPPALKRGCARHGASPFFVRCRRAHAAAETAGDNATAGATACRRLPAAHKKKARLTHVRRTQLNLKFQL